MYETTPSAAPPAPFYCPTLSSASAVWCHFGLYWFCLRMETVGLQLHLQTKQKNKKNKSKQIRSSEMTPHGILSVNRQGFCSSVVSWLSNTARSLIAVMRYWTAWSQNSPHQYNHGYCCVPLEWKINVRCWNRNHSAAIAFFFLYSLYSVYSTFCVTFQSYVAEHVTLK